MPKISTNNVSSYSHISSREEIGDDKAAGKSRSLEIKKGTLTSLKTKFANLKAKITGTESKQAVEKRLAKTQASSPITKEEMTAALKNIHEQRIATIPARKKVQSAHNKPESSASSGAHTINPRLKNPLLFFDTAAPSDDAAPPPYSLHDPLTGPPSPTYVPTPPTPEQLHGPKPMDVHTLRSAITNGLTKALQGERGNLIDKEDIQKFSDNLSISLGLNQGKLSFDQYSAMIVMKSEIDAFLLPDVKSNFDKLMLSLENQLMNS